MSIEPSKGIAGLKGALRYVRAYRDQTFVIKLGGEVLQQAEALAQVAAQISLLSSLGVRLVIVHPSPPAGLVGPGPSPVLSALRAHHVRAVGRSGVDAELVSAHKRPPVDIVDDSGQTQRVDFGHVGDIERVDPRVLETLLQADYVPVVSCLASDEQGNVYNINADTLAESLAVALRAQKLIFMTSSPGVLLDRTDPSTLVTFADPDDLTSLLSSGVIAGGMRPKVEACIRAATGGVERTHIIDGAAPDSLLFEVFTGAGCGTMIVGRKEKATYLGVDLAALLG